MDDKMLEDIRAQREAAINGTWDWDKWPDGQRGLIRDGIERAIEGFEVAIIECNDAISEYGGALQAVLTEQKEDFIIALVALREKLEREKEPCSFCSRLEEENIECCIAGEDFIEPNYCPMCGRKLEG